VEEKLAVEGENQRRERGVKRLGLFFTKSFLTKTKTRVMKKGK
jgi:hypothetical protein